MSVATANSFLAKHEHFLPVENSFFSGKHSWRNLPSLSALRVKNHFVSVATISVPISKKKCHLEIVDTRYRYQSARTDIASGSLLPLLGPMQREPRCCCSHQSVSGSEVRRCEQCFRLVKPRLRSGALGRTSPKLRSRQMHFPGRKLAGRLQNDPPHPPPFGVPAHALGYIVLRRSSEQAQARNRARRCRRAPRRISRVLPAISPWDKYN